jgi:hypothetical protein
MRSLVSLSPQARDIGGVYNGGYIGGLALACVYGLIAARNAVSVAGVTAAPT